MPYFYYLTLMPNKRFKGYTRPYVARRHGLLLLCIISCISYLVVTTSTKWHPYYWLLGNVVQSEAVWNNEMLQQLRYIELARTYVRHLWRNHKNVIDDVASKQKFALIISDSLSLMNLNTEYEEAIDAMFNSSNIFSRIEKTCDNLASFLSLYRKVKSLNDLEKIKTLTNVLREFTTFNEIFLTNQCVSLHEIFHCISEKTHLTEILLENQMANFSSHLTMLVNGLNKMERMDDIFSDKCGVNLSKFELCCSSKNKNISNDTLAIERKHFYEFLLKEDLRTNTDLFYKLSTSYFHFLQTKKLNFNANMSSSDSLHDLMNLMDKSESNDQLLCVGDLMPSNASLCQMSSAACILPALLIQHADTNFEYTSTATLRRQSRGILKTCMTAALKFEPSIWFEQSFVVSSNAEIYTESSNLDLLSENKIHLIAELTESLLFVYRSNRDVVYFEFAKKMMSSISGYVASNAYLITANSQLLQNILFSLKNLYLIFSLDSSALNLDDFVLNSSGYALPKVRRVSQTRDLHVGAEEHLNQTTNSLSSVPRI